MSLLRSYDQFTPHHAPTSLSRTDIVGGRSITRKGAFFLLPFVALVSCVLLTSCGAPQAQGRLSSISAPIVHFPADQANHPNSNNEWWYVVGHLQSGRRSFGFEATIFKLNRFSAPGFNSPLSLYRTDLAITDERARRFPHQVTYYFPQSGRLSPDTLNAQVGKSSLIGTSPQNMTLLASFGRNSIALHLSSQRRPMLVGGRGYLPMGDGYTYYYSLTDLASTGSLRLGGKTYPVSGISWLDHQWGNWSWGSIRGWTWMCWQLGNGTQMSLFDFRSSHGHLRGASVLLPNGTLRSLKRASIVSTGRWLSPHNGALYPSGWIVRVPDLKITMTVRPTVRDQEMTSPLQFAATYWEGSSTLQGTFMGKPVSGVGYTELTGYAGHISPA